MKSTFKKTPGVIRVDEVYRADEFRGRAGLNDFSWRGVRRAGLRVVRVNRKVYVRGSDWFDFLTRIESGEIRLATK
jgi:hypothetical protein